MIVVGITLRLREIECPIGPLGSQTALQIELANVLAELSVTGVRVLVEREVVAQVARQPVAVAERILGDEEISVAGE